MINLEQARFNPTSIFKRPTDVLEDKSLTREEKIDILRRWAYDEREMAVAEEENMLNPYYNSGSRLDEILRCLLKLGVHTDQLHTPPTKQG